MCASCGRRSARNGLKPFKALDTNSPPKSEAGWLDQKYPPSVFVGLITAIAITVIYTVLRLIAGDVTVALVWEILSMFLFSLMGLTAVLEFFLYRRLKQLDAEHAREVQAEINRLKEMEAYRREFLGDVSHE